MYELAFRAAEDSEDEETLADEEQEEQVAIDPIERPSLPTSIVQINPRDVDYIIEEVIWKESWRSKLERLENKWKRECIEQNISEASVNVAFEILRDIHLQGSGSKECCGCCGADPKTEINEEHSSYYPRTAKFCECPCPFCCTKHPRYRDAIVIDNFIPNDLKQRLKLEIEKLENIPEEEKDWHPGSNKQVLDLIHPSLYCYVNKGSVIVSEKKETSPLLETISYQWLPAEFEVIYNSDYSTKADPTVKINSYINNIDLVKQPELYEVIGKIFGKFHQQMKNTKDFNKIGREKKLQVIVKAANIIVTPDKPYYSGGTFHREGMPNENIYATGIYYYHSENVKNSYLEFRSEISKTEYKQDDVEGVFSKYGLHDGDLQFKSKGAILTKEDRGIIFGNVDQHRVRHFFPTDASQPAIRKILVFFIVNPSTKIISTKDVDVQRLDFLMSRCFILNKLLPFTIVHFIVKFLPHFTHEQALKYREELMIERKYHTDEENILVERPFSLCEH